jgi:hypothetical protein
LKDETMRELNEQETLLVSGGWHSDIVVWGSDWGWDLDFTKFLIKNYLEESKAFYDAMEKAEEEALREDLERLANEQNGFTPAPVPALAAQPSAPPVMWSGGGGGFSWDHHVNLH